MESYRLVYSITRIKLLVIFFLLQHIVSDGWRYKYVGCFWDDFDRALPHQIDGYFHNACECNVACCDAGFKYSGRQYFGECHCGNAGYDKHGPSNMCNDCDALNVGPWLSCVYEATRRCPMPTSVPNPQPASVSPVLAPGERFHYLGCFWDDFDRALPHRINGYFHTVAACSVACYAAGYKYSGRQFFGECHCGNSGYDKHGSSDMCNDCDALNVGPWLSCVYEADTEPSLTPSIEPSVSIQPTFMPSRQPSVNPSSIPSVSGQPSSEPSHQPSTSPSSIPSSEPSSTPSVSSQPSYEPSHQPSSTPSVSGQPSSEPSRQPSSTPSVSSQPSYVPSHQPSTSPSSIPSSGPSSIPSVSGQPSSVPSHQPSTDLSLSSSAKPSNIPSSSSQPSVKPNHIPSSRRSVSNQPTSLTHFQPTIKPRSMPSSIPSVLPMSTALPTKVPSASSVLTGNRNLRGMY